LISLVGELSAQSELFRQRWASRDEPGPVLNVYTAPAGSPTADALKLLTRGSVTRSNAWA
jgi:hypothetical protein